MNEIITFITTYKDNPQIFEIIESIRTNIPESKIVVWADCSSDEHIRNIQNKVDICIDSNINLGIARAVGYALLYLEYKYIVVTADDFLFPEKYWNSVKLLLDDEKVGVVGEVYPHNNKDNQKLIFEPKQIGYFPDGPWVIKREVINQVGGINPIFENYEPFHFELLNRVQEKGWKIISMCSGVKHLGHFASDNREQGVNTTQEMSKGWDKVNKIKELTKQNWWKKYEY